MEDETKTDEQKPEEKAAELLVQLKAENDRADKRSADELLAGKTDAGEQPEVKKEETPEEYAKKVMSGEVEGK